MLPEKRPPSHPSEILLEEFLKPLQIESQTKFFEIINNKLRITEELALDFADLFGTSAQFWLNLQSNYDRWNL